VSSPFSGIPAPDQTPARHQYIDRASGSIRDERLYWDSVINFIYSDVREVAPSLFRALIAARASRHLGFLNYDSALGARLLGPIEFARKSGVSLSECLEDPATLDTARKFFERKIKYWESRPMPDGSGIVVSPADARVLVGSLCESSALFIKGKFFTYEELLGADQTQWVEAFKDGDFAIFRLTPEKYHYNHTPVAGCLLAFYQVDGDFHSCNPGPGTDCPGVHRVGPSRDPSFSQRHVRGCFLDRNRSHQSCSSVARIAARRLSWPRPVFGLPGDGSDFGGLLFEYCAAGFRKHSPVATQLVCRISCDLDAGSFSLHRRFVDCRLSLHWSKLCHGVPRLVLRAALQNLGRLDRGTVRVPNSRSKYGEAHSSVLSIKGGKRPSSCRGKRMFTKMSQYRLGVLACAFVVSLVARAQDVSFYEPGHVRSEYPAGQNLRNGIASGDLNNDGHPDVVVTTYNGVSVLLASPDGSSFLPALSYPVGFNTPVYVAIGDVNRDGRLDIVVTTYYGIYWLRGNGDGTFQSATSVPGSYNSVTFLQVIDVNGDDRLDIVASSDSGTLYVVLGNGDGTFQNQRNITLAGPVGAIAADDFNRDGRLDLVTTVSNNLVLLLGNGDGTFAAPRALPVASPRIAVSADFNGDHIPDLAVLQPSSVSLLLGNGDGTFQLTRPSPINANPTDIKAGDMNLDGISDVVVTHCGGSVSVLLANGDGTLQPPIGSGTSGCVTALALADVDRDGYLDMVGNKPDNSVVILMPGNGDGTVGPNRPSVGASPYSVAVGDFNEDGINDLAVANSGSNSFSLLLGNGNATFQVARSIPVGLRPTSMAAGRFTNSGHLDLAVVNSSSDDVSVLRGRGDGTFIQLGAVIVGSNPQALILGDFNNDRSLDMAVVRDLAVVVLLGNGNGTFQPPTSYNSGVSFPTSVAKGDFNRDGNDDLVVTGGSFFSSNISVLLGNGQGGFQTPRPLTGNRGPSSAAVGDLNGDGLPDIAVANSGSNNVTVFLGNGDGTFQPGVDFFVLGNTPLWVVIDDFNGDGRLDMATANSQSNYVSILVNVEVPGAPVFSPVSFIDAGEFPVGAGPRSLAVADFNSHQQPDLAVVNNGSNDVTLLINSTR